MYRYLDCELLGLLRTYSLRQSSATGLLPTPGGEVIGEEISLGNEHPYFNIVRVSLRYLVPLGDTRILNTGVPHCRPRYWEQS